MATKCDKCGELFEATHQTVSLGEIAVMRSDRKTCDTWSDVDFCPKCSVPILELVRPALTGIEETLQEKS